MNDSQKCPHCGTPLSPGAPAGLCPVCLLEQGAAAETRYRLDPADHLSPDKIYDREWALTVLERVIARLREECAAHGKAKQFDALKDFLTAGQGALAYADAAARAGLEEGTARVGVHRLRRRYREMLREEIAQTLADPGQIEDQMQALRASFTP